MRRHGFLAIMLACATASAAWLLNQHHPLVASEETAGSFREAFRGRSDQPEPAEDDTGIRLNFFDAGWERVLRDVAKQSELTLVMDKIPHGTFARRDRNRYHIDSVVRILNSELEPQGFRLLQQQQFLIVLKLDQARTRYARPILNDWKNNDAATQSRAASQEQQQHRDSRFHTASARKEDDAPRVAWASQEQNGANRKDAPQQSERLPFADRVVPEPRQSPQTAPQTQDEGPAILKTITVEHGKASEIARSIYLVFESRAELVGSGLQNLPTVVVQRSPEAENEAAPEADASVKPLFRLAIDQANNQLVVEASKARAEHLAKLVHEIDKPAEQQAGTVKLVPSQGVSDVTAKDLNEQIHRMVAMQTQSEQPGNAAAQRPFGPPLDAQSTEGSLNLRGEVNVQAMQDLGILILKGNEADVAKVEAIIKQLENMSVGSLPDIHLLALQHVNSEAMAELMTSVYDKLSELRNRGNENRQTAAFISVVQPNALLIIAPAIELEAILQLANELDRRTDPESEFQVFSLENAIASQVATAIESFYEERGGLGTRVRVVPDLRTNAIIVQGRANDLSEISTLIEKFDRAEPGAVHRVEIVELKHATAEELAATINTAIQSVSSPPQQSTTGGGGFGANQAAQELRDGKSAALEFLATSGNARELIRSGILVDVRINADPRSNSLIISAPEASMSLLKALVQQLDRAPSAIAEIKVFSLQNADATQSVDLLTSLFENQNQEDQLGVQIAGTEDAASSLIPVQFSADVRTNTVLAVGSGESLSVVEAILLRLDTAESRQRRTVVIPLRNAQAEIVAAALESFLEQQQSLQDSSEDLISNIERLRQEVIVAPDNNSNSLIVSASPEYFSEISQIITELDANPPQVVIQALLVEVQLDNTDEFGVELGFQDPLLFSRGLIDTVETITQTGLDPVTGFTTNNQTVISANGNPGFNFNNTTAGLGNNVSGLIPGQAGINTSSTTVATQGISNFSLGRQNGDLGFGGFVFSAQSDAVSVLVRALAARRTVHVLSRPQIRTTHNNVASIQVGQKVPVVNGVTVTNNLSTPNIEQQDVGIILRVTPRVTPDGTISMEVYAEKSALAPGGVPVFTDANTGNVVESVIIDTAIADTTVSVPNGQTIVIGGMITKSDDTLERKVPWLGDLPLVGSLFRYDGTNTRRTELLIFLTPRIVYSDADSELIKQVEAERLHFIESDAEEIHGPLYSVPPSYLDHPMMPGDQYPESELVPELDGLSLPPQAYPADSLNEMKDSEFVLPPQAATTDQPSGASKPETSATVPTRQTGGPNPIIQTASQSAQTSDSDNFEKWRMNRALSTTTLGDAQDTSPEKNAAAAEWVRQVLRAKQQREQQTAGDTPAADTTAASAPSEATSPKPTQSTTDRRKVTQTSGQRSDAEPIQTLSAAEAATDDSALPQKAKTTETSWMRRLLKPRKSAK